VAGAALFSLPVRRAGQIGDSRNAGWSAPPSSAGAFREAAPAHMSRDCTAASLIFLVFKMIEFDQSS